jgi:hypothetical protein
MIRTTSGNRRPDVQHIDLTDVLNARIESPAGGASRGNFERDGRGLRLAPLPQELRPEGSTGCASMGRNLSRRFPEGMASLAQRQAPSMPSKNLFFGCFQGFSAGCLIKSPAFNLMLPGAARGI